MSHKIENIKKTDEFFDFFDRVLEEYQKTLEFYERSAGSGGELWLFCLGGGGLLPDEF